MSNGLDPDSDQRSVCPDLGPNSWQQISADDKSAASKDRVKSIYPCKSSLALIQ